jgi:hypothetical protein
MGTKLTVKIQCEPKSLYCGDCKMIIKEFIYESCTVFNQSLKHDYDHEFLGHCDYYYRLRCQKCLDSEQEGIMVPLSKIEEAASYHDLGSALECLLKEFKSNVSIYD